MSIDPPLSYVVPFSAHGGDRIEPLLAYLGGLARLAEVILVDGSSEDRFRQHREALDDRVRHLRPDSDLGYQMGKVNAVITGARHASHESIVIADDDVRYTEDALRELVGRLERAHLVVPQNYFRPLPWHARWDTARTLLNRAFTGDRWFPVGDFPGTMAVRRQFFLEIRAYDGDLIFENLELMRTVRAAGGTVDVVLGLYVRRVPPVARWFLTQRVRQAYDDFAIPARMVTFLSIAPMLARLPAARRGRATLALALGSIAIAEVGRRRANGARVYSASASAMAPAWIAERAVCSWLALAQRLIHGGTAYRGKVIRRAATPPRELRRRYWGARLGASKPAAL